MFAFGFASLFVKHVTCVRREYKRMNDECADKIADNRYSIEHSREWLADDGGVMDRVHRMSAKTVMTSFFVAPSLALSP